MWRGSLYYVTRRKHMASLICDRRPVRVVGPWVRDLYRRRFHSYPLGDRTGASRFQRAYRTRRVRVADRARDVKTLAA